MGLGVMNGPDGDREGQQGTAAGDQEAEYKSQGAGLQAEVVQVLP